MAEIRIEQKQRSILPWILGLALLALVIAGLAALMGREDGRRTRETGGAAAAESTWDTPPHLRQYASVRGIELAPAA